MVSVLWMIRQLFVLHPNHWSSERRYPQQGLQLQMLQSYLKVNEHKTNRNGMSEKKGLLDSNLWNVGNWWASTTAHTQIHILSHIQTCPKSRQSLRGNTAISLKKYIAKVGLLIMYFIILSKPYIIVSFLHMCALTHIWEKN